MVTPPVKVTITVVDAQQLPKPAQQSKGEVIDPYVLVELVGADEDLATVCAARANLVPGDGADGANGANGHEVGSSPSRALWRRSC